MAKPRKNLVNKGTRKKSPLKPACMVDLEDAWNDFKEAALKAYDGGFDIELRGDTIPFCHEMDEDDDEYCPVELTIRERPKQPELKEFRLS